MSFWTWAAGDPDRLALVDADGAELRAGVLLARAHRLAHALRARGIRERDTVAALLPNGAALIELHLATAELGVYLTPINAHLAAPEVRFIAEDAEAKAVFTCPALEAVAREALEGLGALRVSTAPLPGFEGWEAFVGEAPSHAPEGRKGGLVMTYTSGTTGKPRGVRRPLAEQSPEGMAASYAGFLMLFGITPGSRGVHLVSSPLYHTAVFNFATSFLHLGHTLVLMDRWSPEGTLALIARHHVTSSHMVPTHFSRLLALPEDVRAAFDPSSLTHVIHSAAPCPVPVKAAMLEWWGPCIYEYYAASEGGGTLATPADWLKKPGTVGKAWPISAIEIRDERGQVCPPNTPGTVYMRMGEHRFEYHRDRDKTEDAWSGRFFTVGDVGYLDEDAYLFLCDRKIDLIISGGVNIYPAEIEAALLACPEVVDAAVFGIPHEDWGEEVKAVVELAPGFDASEATRAAISARLRAELAAFKCPRTIDFAAALPRDPNGKLYKRRLRDPYWEGRPRAI